MATDQNCSGATSREITQRRLAFTLLGLLFLTTSPTSAPGRLIRLHAVILTNRFVQTLTGPTLNAESISYD
eukprot:301932-Lingulodinium_polyedra.AAC.1